MEKSLDFHSRFHLNGCSRGTHLRHDRISSLPVEVLLIILSLLPLKEMVKASILSKRWLNLWVNTPVLDFYLGTVGFNNMREIRTYFVYLVNRVLQQHKGLYLKKFRICCNIMNDYREDIDKWLEFALARKVEILELDFLVSSDFVANDHNYVFPDCWFSSGKANVDGGKSRDLQYNLKFLKSLSLKNVNVIGEAINFFLRNCPSLERFELVGSDRLVNLVISDPNLVLKYLKVKQCRHGLKVLSISNFNLVSLDTSVGDLILKDLPMLVELHIYGYANNLRRILSQNATCLRQLVTLELHAFDLKEVTELLPILAQLTKLKRLVINYLAKVDESLIVLLYVIKSCNHLEEFVLELKWYYPKRLTRAMQKIERLSCESLKLFEFKGYYGRASDVELIMHVVKNAPCLEKIIIGTSNLTLRSMNFPEDSNEKEARRYALKHLKCLKETKYIPPHVKLLMYLSVN